LFIEKVNANGTLHENEALALDDTELIVPNPAKLNKGNVQNAKEESPRKYVEKLNTGGEGRIGDDATKLKDQVVKVPSSIYSK
jgi:hypothetical protein